MSAAFYGAPESPIWRLLQSGDLTPAQFLVATWLYRKGHKWPVLAASHAYIATCTNTSVSTVQRTIGKLIELGLMTKAARFRGRLRTSNAVTWIKAALAAVPWSPRRMLPKRQQFPFGQADRGRPVNLKSSLSYGGSRAAIGVSLAGSVPDLAKVALERARSLGLGVFSPVPRSFV